MTDIDMDSDEEGQLAGFEPLSLFDICLGFISDDLSVLCVPGDEGSQMAIRDDAILPAEICDRLVRSYQAVARITDDFAEIFQDRKRTRVRRLTLRNSPITNSGFLVFLRHRLEELDITDCDNLTQVAFEYIHRYMTNMESLSIASTSQNNNIKLLWLKPDMRPLKLKRLALKEYHVTDLRGCMHLLVSLTHLELSGCVLQVDPSYTLDNLVSLSLYNVELIERSLEWLCKLRSLQHLDISQHTDRFGNFNNPNETLAKIVTSLPVLKSLDISGTNLAGTGAAASDKTAALCDIPGLSSRVDNPLHFIGLYATAHSACCRHDIPALKISGHATEEQILTAATLYIERPEVLSRVLNDLFHLFRSEPQKHGKALTIVLKAMDAHINQKHIQICASATLFYIVKGKCDAMGIKLRRQIITTLLNSMEKHLDDPTMMRNGCLTLCQFKIPGDVVFDYERVVSILLSGVSNGHQENFVQRIATYLLNSLACQVDARQKQFLGDLGVISIMLSLISERLQRKLCDDVLEVAWSTMWNVTDETSINCQRFLNDNGLELFLGCLKSFPDKAELLRNMMGLLGNVAEVQQLRPVFMADFLIAEFVNLLDSNSDGIEVSYNAAGVLAHIASDGEAAWTTVKPTREEVLRKMVNAIEKWDIKSRRNINYRSFEPLVGLLKAYHTPQCQHWAIWALANLTTVYPDKYCSLVKAENGIELLNEIISSPTPYSRIKNLAKSVLDNCEKNIHKGMEN